MRPNILKFKVSNLLPTILLPTAAILICLAAAVPRAQAAAKPALTLTNGAQQFAVTQGQLNEWKIAPQTPGTNISFEPEKNGKDYIMGALGLQNNATSYIDYQNYNTPQIYSYLKSIEPQIDQDAENAVFTTGPTPDANGNPIVTDFNPGENGQDLDIKSSIVAIETALDTGAASAALSVNQTLPQNTLAQTNNLGINGLIAEGDSNYSGSPANRIWNIKVGVQKETGVVIKPGEEFSFNQFLGPVDEAHGFKPELVITSNATLPEAGGGLCQVSTTMFRAAMNAGFPITERRNHSYAVEYYSPQGTDATIYPGVQDLKYINDTSADIMIWSSYPGPNQLRFSIYGTKDARQVAFQGPVVYDRKPDGSMKATWTRFVTSADGTKRTDVFNSDYLSPSLFKLTTEFPPVVTPAATTPDATAAPATGPAPASIKMPVSTN